MAESKNHKNNPLVIPILEILTQAEQAIGEHELIVVLKQQLADLPNQTNGSQLALFQTHFMVMNALYQLQSQVGEDGFYLSVSPLAIELLSITTARENVVTDVGVDQKLREYYLDWNNLDDTSEGDVDQLLNGFWSHYLAADKQSDAYGVLGLTPEAQWSEVSAAYRRQVAENHPDRGGSAAQFMAVREAYEVLQQVRNS